MPETEDIEQLRKYRNLYHDYQGEYDWLQETIADNLKWNKVHIHGGDPDVPRGTFDYWAFELQADGVTIDVDDDWKMMWREVKGDGPEDTKWEAKLIDISLLEEDGALFTYEVEQIR